MKGFNFRLSRVFIVVLLCTFSALSSAVYLKLEWKQGSQEQRRRAVRARTLGTKNIEFHFLSALKDSKDLQKESDSSPPKALDDYFSRLQVLQKLPCGAGGVLIDSSWVLGSKQWLVTSQERLCDLYAREFFSFLYDEDIVIDCVLAHPNYDIALAHLSKPVLQHAPVKRYLGLLFSEIESSKNFNLSLFSLRGNFYNEESKQYTSILPSQEALSVPIAFERSLKNFNNKESNEAGISTDSADFQEDFQPDSRYIFELLNIEDTADSYVLQSKTESKDIGAPLFGIMQSGENSKEEAYLLGFHTGKVRTSYSISEALPKSCKETTSFEALYLNAPLSSEYPKTINNWITNSIVMDALGEEIKPGEPLSLNEWRETLALSSLTLDRQMIDGYVKESKKLTQAEKNFTHCYKFNLDQFVLPSKFKTLKKRKKELNDMYQDISVFTRTPKLGRILIGKNTVLFIRENIKNISHTVEDESKLKVSALESDKLEDSKKKEPPNGDDLFQCWTHQVSTDSDFPRLMAGCLKYPLRECFPLKPLNTPPVIGEEYLLVSSHLFGFYQKCPDILDFNLDNGYLCIPLILDRVWDNGQLPVVTLKFKEGFEAFLTADFQVSKIDKDDPKLSFEGAHLLKKVAHTGNASEDYRLAGFIDDFCPQSAKNNEQKASTLDSSFDLKNNNSSPSSQDASKNSDSHFIAIHLGHPQFSKRIIPWIEDAIDKFSALSNEVSSKIPSNQESEEDIREHVTESEEILDEVIIHDKDKGI